VSAVTAVLPDTASLAAGLERVLGQGARQSVRVLERVTNEYASTFPSETVTVSTADGRRLELFCKYTAGRSHASFGHRGDVPYESCVYERILRHSTLTVPAYLGRFDDVRHGDTCLVIESLRGVVLVDEAPVPARALEGAARWIARFHAETASLVDSTEGSFLRRYAPDYYRQWSRRTSVLAGRWHERLPWLAGVCERFDDVAEDLARASQSVVHGEFVPHNILARGDEIYPIDWESAAVGLAEIDLVSLTDKWPDETRLLCERAYRAAVQQAIPEGEFAHRLDMARLYWDFRWLGDRPEWTVLEKVAPRFEHLRSAAERLGLLS
jgi:hypothetical protein